LSVARSKTVKSETYLVCKKLHFVMPKCSALWWHCKYVALWIYVSNEEKQSALFIYSKYNSKTSFQFLTYGLWPLRGSFLIVWVYSILQLYPSH